MFNPAPAAGTMVGEAQVVGGGGAGREAEAEGPEAVRRRQDEGLPHIAEAHEHVPAELRLVASEPEARRVRGAGHQGDVRRYQRGERAAGADKVDVGAIARQHVVQHAGSAPGRLLEPTMLTPADGVTIRPAGAVSSFGAAWRRSCRRARWRRARRARASRLSQRGGGEEGFQGASWVSQCRLILASRRSSRCPPSRRETGIGV